MIINFKKILGKFKHTEEDKTLRKVELWVDGCCKGNPGKCGIGAVVKSLGGEYVFAAYAGEGTNNTAEYNALLFGLEKTTILYGKEIDLHIYSDSNLLVRQMRQEWGVSNETLRGLRDTAFDVCKEISNVSVTWIPRSENEMADQAANEGFKNGKDK